MIAPAIPEQAHRGSLAGNLIDFAAVLRGLGLQVSLAETHDALRALRTIDLGSKTEFFLALRTVMTSRPEDLAVFGEAFDRFWLSGPDGLSWAEESDRPSASDATADETALESGAEPEADSPDADSADEPEGDTHASGYSAEQLLAAKDFSHFDTAELEDMIRLTLRIARRMATRLSRRTVRSPHGATIDRRRTLRLNLKYGGDVVELARKRRKIKKTKLVLLCDVSGSMDVYSQFLLQFIYAMQHNFARTESFVFSTELSRVTDYFREQDIHAALRRIADQVLDWSGGTRIGQSLGAFNADWAASVLDRRTVVIILSDGWDTGDADVLEREMAALERRAGRVIWLNPLIANPGYQPLCRGMRTALPYVQVFAPAHNLDSLMELERHLVL